MAARGRQLNGRASVFGPARKVALMSLLHGCALCAVRQQQQLQARVNNTTTSLYRNNVFASNCLWDCSPGVQMGSEQQFQSE